MVVRMGQCYTKVGMPYPDVWQVVGLVSPPGCREPHVRLTRIEQPADVKTVSMAALEDTTLYRTHDENLVLRRRLDDRGWRRFTRKR
jgi:hypothetical protein